MKYFLAFLIILISFVFTKRAADKKREQDKSRPLAEPKLVFIWKNERILIDNIADYMELSGIQQLFVVAAESGKSFFLPLSEKERFLEEIKEF